MIEEWRKIPDFDNYMVSSLGIIKHISTTLKRVSKYGTEYNYTKSELILRLSTAKGGTRYIGLHNQTEIRKFVVCDLVASIFEIPNPDQFDTIIHLDGNRGNNSVGNLRWGGEKLFLEGEVWRTIESSQGMYNISNLGRVKSTEHGRMHKILKYQYNDYGYPYVFIWCNGERKARTVHRLVAETFIPNPNNFPVVNHLDSNPGNPKVDNLEWCTTKQNVRHSIIFGRGDKRGEKCSTAKLTEEKVKEIIGHLKERKLTVESIARMYSVSTGTITAINIGKNWSHLSDEYPIRRYFKTRYKNCKKKSNIQLSLFE
jgi:hypothetical protein